LLDWKPQYEDIETIAAHALAWEEKLSRERHGELRRAVWERYLFKTAPDPSSAEAIHIRERRLHGNSTHDHTASQDDQPCRLPDGTPGVTLYLGNDVFKECLY